jgi:glucokinase
MDIGVDLGGTNIRAGLVDKSGVLSQSRHLLTNKHSVDSTVNQLIETIKPHIQPGVKSIGIGVPSVVDVKNGIVFDVVNIPSWKRVELKCILEKEFAIPVFVNNDVNCFALGEHRFGIATQFDSFVAIAMGTGLGAGLIINRKLYAGQNCGAGEVGSMPYLQHTYEYYTSGMFFEQMYQTPAHEAHDKAINGDAHFITAWEMLGQHLGNVLKTVLYVYDPEAIVFGGSVSKARNLFEQAMMQELRTFQFQESVKNLRILFSQNPDIAILGAASLSGNRD